MLNPFYKLIAGGIVLFSLVFMISKTMAEEIKLVTGEYPPFTSNKIPGGGIVSEIVQLTFSRMGLTGVVDYLPWKRGYFLTSKNKYAATYPYLITEERKQDFLYSEPIVEWSSKVYVRHDSDVVYTKPQDLEGLTECLPHHYGGLKPFDELFDNSKIRRIRPPHIRSCWLMVLNGRADFFIEDVFVADIFRKEVLGERYHEVKELKNTISIDYGYVIFPLSSPRSEGLLKRFNKTLFDLLQSEEIAKIRERFIVQNRKVVELME